MTFPEAEKAYKSLKTQHDAGKLSDAAFEAEVGKLRMQDTQGRWWQIGVQTGEWYMHDGQKWNKAKPPVTAAPPSVEPAAIPEAAGATTIKINSTPKAPAVAKPEPAKREKEKEGGAQVQARLFSPKPADSGKGRGLPRGALIAIIVVVALLGVAILVGGFFFITSQLGGGTQARATATLTRAVAVASPALPTVPPTLAASPTPLPPPTPVIAPSPVVTPTNPPAATKPAGPTAVRKVTVTPTKPPAGSPTPNVPPGVYAMKLETDPAKVSVGSDTKVGFKLTTFNNTGGVQTFKKWFVRVFQCPEQCTGETAYRASYGESLKFDVNVATGSSVITTPQHMNFGPGRCEYTAVPYYTGENEIATPFMTTKGAPLYYNFSVCN